MGPFLGSVLCLGRAAEKPRLDADEVFDEIADALGGAGHQVAARSQSAGDVGQHGLLRRSVEVDQHILEEHEIKRALARGWPVCGGFLWPNNEGPLWKNGVLQMCPRSDVMDGHSVLLVGFRDDKTQPGGGVFLIRNSAGACRDSMLSYEYIRAYMNDAAWIDFAGASEGGPRP